MAGITKDVDLFLNWKLYKHKYIMPNELTLNKQGLISLKKSYEKAVKSKKKSFRFDGKEMVTGYAKHVIDYLEVKLKNTK